MQLKSSFRSTKYNIEFSVMELGEEKNKAYLFAYVFDVYL